MRTLMISILTGLLTAFSGNVPRTERNDFEEPYRKLNNKAFRAGEKASYLVHYGFIDAGYAHLEIKAAENKMNGRDMLHIVGKGESQGMVDFFFHVEDRYETYIDKQGVFPWLFIRNISEGGYNCQQKYKFLQNKNKVETQKGKVHDVPGAVQDMLSAAFYARTLDLRNLKNGEIVTVTTFVDDELFNLKIRYRGVEEIEIKTGRYRCLKFNPVIQTGRLFNAEEDLHVWISDDENKLPILCQADILVGSIKVELANYQGLANPLAKLSD